MICEKNKKNKVILLLDFLSLYRSHNRSWRSQSICTRRACFVYSFFAAVVAGAAAGAAAICTGCCTMTVVGVASPAESATRSRMSASVPIVAAGATAIEDSSRPPRVLRRKARRPTAVHKQTHAHIRDRGRCNDERLIRLPRRAEATRCPRCLQRARVRPCPCWLVDLHAADVTAANRVTPPMICAGYCARAALH